MSISRFLVFSCALLSFQIHAQYQIWLMSGPDCNICSIFDNVKQNRAYQHELTVNSQVFSLLAIDKQQIPAHAKHLFTDYIKSNNHWPLQLTIAVIKDNQLLKIGNIAESVNWNNSKINQLHMTPPETETLNNLANYKFNYPAFFEQQLNLEYFAKGALDNTSVQSNEVKIALNSLSLPAHNIQTSIWGTAKQPAENGQFISTRIKQIQHLIGLENSITTYANGHDQSRRDTLIKKAERYLFKHSNVPAQYSSDLNGVGQMFNHVKQANNDKHLLIQVGHSSPAGIPIWGSPLTISKDMLADAIAQTNKAITFVSGACHSGLLSHVAQCGFYAAHPEAIATGCQVSLEAIEASDDYLKYFFLTEHENKDTNNDGNISFNEAHWFATASLERHNISYSDVDAKVDDYFKRYPDSLPTTIKLKDLALLIELLSKEEQHAFKIMSQHLDKSLNLNLKNYVIQHKQAIERLKDFTESSSEKRNEVSQLAYPLSLILLARKALFIHSGQVIPKTLVQCGQQTIKDYW